MRPTGRLAFGTGVMLALTAVSFAASAIGAGRPDPARFLSVDRAGDAVTLTLIAGDGGDNNGFNFDDYGRGELLATVPLGWRVHVVCRNASDVYNSCVVITGPGATAPAFTGASSPNPVTGLAPGASASFSFVASRVGSYRLASMVPGHELARMWDVLVVARGGAPSIVARPGP